MATYSSRKSFILLLISLLILLVVQRVNGVSKADQEETSEENTASLISRLLHSDNERTRLLAARLLNATEIKQLPKNITEESYLTDNQEGKGTEPFKETENAVPGSESSDERKIESQTHPRKYSQPSDTWKEPENEEHFETVEQKTQTESESNTASGITGKDGYEEPEQNLNENTKPKENHIRITNETAMNNTGKANAVERNMEHTEGEAETNRWEMTDEHENQEQQNELRNEPSYHSDDKGFEKDLNTPTKEYNHNLESQNKFEQGHRADLAKNKLTNETDKQTEVPESDAKEKKGVENEEKIDLHEDKLPSDSKQEPPEKSEIENNENTVLDKKHPIMSSQMSTSKAISTDTKSSTSTVNALTTTSTITMQSTQKPTIKAFQNFSIEKSSKSEKPGLHSLLVTPDAILIHGVSTTPVLKAKNDANTFSFAKSSLSSISMKKEDSKQVINLKQQKTSYSFDREGLYSSTSLVSAAIGGAFIGGFVVFLFFYCKSKFSRYYKGNYQRVPMEYDFELNPRLKSHTK